MKRNELASEYLTRYEDTDIIITDVTTFDISGYGDCDSSNPVAFDLSDGTYWFADNNDICQVGSSLTDIELGWDDWGGWCIVNEDGTKNQIDWL